MMLSVLVITYNHEKYIRETINGILMQQVDFTYEVVIGEDCSTDNTREICLEYQKQFPDKIRLLLSNQNLGMNANFYNTLNACKSKYIAFCEGDDYWTDPLKLQKQVDFLESNPEYVIHSGASKIMEEGILTDKLIGYDHTPRDFSLVDFFDKNNLVSNTITFRNVSNEVISSVARPPFGDWYLYAALLKYTDLKAYRSNDVFSVYRIHNRGVFSSMSVISRHINHISQILWVKKLVDYGRFPREVIHSLNNHCLGLFEIYIKERSYCKALRIFLKNCSLCHFYTPIKQYLANVKSSISNQLYGVLILKNK